MRLSWLGQSLTVLAPAKLNLSLKVLGRRPDGFHDLQTVMISVRLYDTLRFLPTRNETVTLNCRTDHGLPSNLPTDERNLVMQAARLLQQETRTQQGVDISLQKRIPAEAGMGGGSSDAAATLVSLNQFWKLNLPSSHLHDLAARLGSDVNFFLDSPRAALCTGRGEKIQTLPLRQALHGVVVKPPTGLSTADVFRRLQVPVRAAMSSEDSTADALSEMSLFSENGNGVDWKRGLVNDLEGPARSINHEVDGLLKQFGRENVLASGMTGSGSACFALCSTARQAQVLANRFRQRRLGQVFTVTAGV